MRATQILAVSCAFNFVAVMCSGELGKSLIPRHGSHFFVRLNSKVNILRNTGVFAYASGFRLNWDIRPYPHSQKGFSHKTSLHRSIESLLDAYGFEGRACLIKAFCELADIQHQDDIITKLLVLIFKVEEAAVCINGNNCPISLVSLAYLIYDVNIQ